MPFESQFTEIIDSRLFVCTRMSVGTVITPQVCLLHIQPNCITVAFGYK